MTSLRSRRRNLNPPEQHRDSLSLQTDLGDRRIEPVLPLGTTNHKALRSHERLELVNPVGHLTRRCEVRAIARIQFPTLRHVTLDLAPQITTRRSEVGRRLN